jgi:hypothetical protein
MQIGYIDDEEMAKLTQQLQHVMNESDLEGTELSEQNQETNTGRRRDKKNRGKWKDIANQRLSVFLF